MTDEQLEQLKQKQFEMAINGDVRMLIWLGKQYLKQRDLPDPMENWDKPFNEIVFAECDDNKCKCKDCNTKVGINMNGLG